MNNFIQKLKKNSLIFSAIFWLTLVLFNFITLGSRSEILDFSLFTGLPILCLLIVYQSFDIKLSSLWWILPACVFFSLVDFFIYHKIRIWGDFLYDYFPAWGGNFVAEKLEKKNIFWFFYLAISAGVAEELFFRYLPWLVYIKDQPFSWQRLAAYFTWSIPFFALIHLNQGATQILNAAVSGLYLGLLMLWTKRYSLLWITHAFIDGLLYWQVFFYAAKRGQ